MTAVLKPDVIPQPEITHESGSELIRPNTALALGNIAAPGLAPETAMEVAATLASIHTRVEARRKALGQNARGREVYAITYPNDHLTVLTTLGQNQGTMHSTLQNPTGMYTGPGPETPAERVHKQQLADARRSHLRIVS